MRKILNSVLLIAGTSIGTGLLSLPISAVSLGMPMTLLSIGIIYWLAYQTSMMVVDLNIFNQNPMAIVELSRKYGGRTCFGLTMLSFYLLSFGLLAVYFSCVSDTLSTALVLSPKGVMIVCACSLFLLLNLHIEKFAAFNSLCVTLLLGSVACALFCFQSHSVAQSTFQMGEWVRFMPIVMTAFGMQTLCPQLYTYLDRDRKRIQIALLLGLLVPAIVYLVWIHKTLSCAAMDPAFLAKLQSHQASIGEFIQFLCDATNSVWLSGILKFLTLFAVITSMIGVAIGLLHSLRMLCPEWLAKVVLCLVPLVVNWFVANAFLRILSFGGLMMIIFAIVTPYWCVRKQNLKDPKRQYSLCLLLGVTVTVFEVIRIILP